MSKVKVLCLCGGGIFGAIIAKFLTYVPKDFVNKIDVLSGCSIGGILTNAYASGADPEKVLHAFL
jgi:patatin-like phospholipase/acyl hydrolase